MTLPAELMPTKAAATALYEEFFLLSPAMFALVGRDGSFLDLNPAWQKALGFASHELMGKSWLDLVVAEDRPAASAGMQMLHRRGETGWSESRWMGADGMARRVLWNAAVSPQERLIFLTAFDIANLKGDSEGAWEWEVATDELTWSEELYRIAGRDPRLPAPRAGEQHHIYAPESWERLKEAVRRALATGESFAVELELLRPDATSRRILSRGQAVRDGAGRVVRLCGRDMDITGPRAPRLSQVQ